MIDTEERADEAGTDEVAALAAVIRRPAHIPAPREDEESDLLDPTESVALAGDEHPVLPRQRDEFCCARCFLVAHVSRRGTAGGDVCRDCS